MFAATIYLTLCVLASALFLVCCCVVVARRADDAASVSGPVAATHVRRPASLTPVRPWRLPEPEAPPAKTAPYRRPAVA